MSYRRPMEGVIFNEIFASIGFFKKSILKFPGFPNVDATCIFCRLEEQFYFIITRCGNHFYNFKTLLYKRFVLI